MVILLTYNDHNNFLKQPQHQGPKIIISLQLFYIQKIEVTIVAMKPSHYAPNLMYPSTTILDSKHNYNGSIPSFPKMNKKKWLESSFPSFSSTSLFDYILFASNLGTIKSLNNV